jgi:DNA invertase Pin-like site-specific DNA recombinase
MKSDYTKKRGVVYARAKENVYGLVSQILMCQEAMKNDMVEEVHPPIKDVASGKSLQRAGLEELQKLTKNRSIDYLYVTTIDRLGRDTVKTLQLLQSLKESGVIVKTTDGEFTFSGLAHIGSM